MGGLPFDFVTKYTDMKVIGFDGWTVGSHNYRRLQQAFAAKHLKLSLLHLGSWGNETGRPLEELIDNLPVRDISYYRGSGFREIISRERPDVVIFLSTDAFAHRAFNRYCREAGVPTLHLFHGLQQFMETIPVENPLRSLFLLRGHLAKQLRHFLPNYFYALLQTGASLADWRRFVVDIVGRILRRRPQCAAPDSVADALCTYIDADVDYAIKNSGYELPQITVVGNPDLASFGLTQDLVDTWMPPTSSECNTFVYVETNLLGYGSIYRSPQEFVAHVESIHRTLLAGDCRLIFKPHPSTSAKILEQIERKGIEICNTQSFVKCLLGSLASIVEPSTAALIPALLGMPLLMASMGRLSRLEFGLLASYPRARYLHSMLELRHVLAEEKSAFDPNLTHRWILENSGPLPAHMMPDRVADALLALILMSRERHVQR